VSLVLTHVVSNRAVSRREGSSDLSEANWQERARPFGLGLDSTRFARQTELQKQPPTRVGCVGIICPGIRRAPGSSFIS
jgi:hypothetical protein